ncbi:MAG: hypothetical protein OEV66_06515 [Spirochaetia bacterium]|nr:hypothetical protein [Spirochaetia bacterium]
MTSGRYYYCASLLANGKVLVTGGATTNILDAPQNCASLNHID